MSKWPCLTRTLRDGEQIIGGDENLIKHGTDYYKELFGLAEEKVNMAENEELTKAFSEEEVKETLYQMEKNKVADPDSISIEFYQSCWSIIKEVIMGIFHEFHLGVLDVSRINYGIITLLPKI